MADTKFKPGESGNPAGKKPGTGKIAEVRKLISKHVPEILERLCQDAKKGDVRATKLVLERYSPAMRAIDLSDEMLPLAGESLTEKGESIFQQVAEGRLSPSQGASLLAGLGNLARVKEIDELTARIAALEERLPR